MVKHDIHLQNYQFVFNIPNVLTYLTQNKSSFVYGNNNVMCATF